MTIAQAALGQALWVAAENNYPVTVKLLLKSYSDSAARQAALGEALCLAAANGHINIIKLLLKNYSSSAVRQAALGQALSQAAAHGHTATVEWLLNSYSDSAARQAALGRALPCAAELGQNRTVKLLLESCSDNKARQAALEADNYKALHLAVVNNFLGVVITLFRACNSEQQAVACRLIENKNSDMYSDLITSGAIAQSANHTGTTAPLIPMRRNSHARFRDAEVATDVHILQTEAIQPAIYRMNV